MATVFQSGCTAVITGGASGIGLSPAKKCASYGMKVLVADWDEELLAAVAQNIGSDVATLKVDVSKPEDWVTLKAKVDADFGGETSQTWDISVYPPLPLTIPCAVILPSNRTL